MKNLNFLRNLFGPAAGLQSNDVSVDRHSTVVRPSFDRRDYQLKRVTRLAAMLCLLFTLGVGNAWGDVITFTGSDSGGWTTSQTSQSGTKNSVILSCTSGLVSGEEIRMYKSQTVTITAPSGYNVTSIVFTCTNNGTTKYGPGCFGAGAPSGYTFETSGPTGTWTGSAASVAFTTTDNQVRATSIVVTITASTTYAVTWKSDGSIVHTDAAVPSGTTVSTPSNPSVPSGCAGGTFMGWTATQNYSADTAPGDLFNGTSPTITGNITFYAVFADEE